jgi:hypothetical protein
MSVTNPIAVSNDRDLGQAFLKQAFRFVADLWVAALQLDILPKSALMQHRNQAVSIIEKALFVELLRGHGRACKQ